MVNVPTKNHCIPPLLLLWVISTLSLSQANSLETILLDDYQSGLSPKWQPKKFHNLTHYTVAKKDKQISIAAESNGSASGLIYKIEYSAEELPFLNWQWQIDHTISQGDAHHKEGDDYAARIYVVFPDFLFWRTKALNYVWANKLQKGTMIPNAYTANAMMIAVESGDTFSNCWVSEERNIYEDFRQAFGYFPKKVGAIAIMTDTDNTGEQARAWYGPIRISKIKIGVSAKSEERDTCLNPTK